MANVQTPKFRVSYPNVFKARMNELKKKEEFGLVALFSKGTDLSALKKAAQDALVDYFGADQKKWPAGIRSPFRKHEEKIIERDDGTKTYPDGMEEGGTFMTLTAKQKPGVVDQNVQDIIVESDFYAGCYARATVSAKAYGGFKTGFTPGVAFYLRNVQKMGEGDPLGSRTKPQDDFAPIEGAAQSASADAGSLFL